MGHSDLLYWELTRAIANGKADDAYYLTRLLIAAIMY